MLDYKHSSQVDVVYTDSAKSFDKVHHGKLLIKLESIGFSSDLIQFFKSYLWERKQYVVYKGSRSILFDSCSGVPQGSNLGPYLFVLYVSDVYRHLQNCHCPLYADDLKLYKEIRTELDSAFLQRDLDALTEWSEENSLR